jgi:hypothetical protein
MEKLCAVDGRPCEGICETTRSLTQVRQCTATFYQEKTYDKRRKNHEVTERREDDE